jgi:hypothetical protein
MAKGTLMKTLDDVRIRISQGKTKAVAIGICLLQSSDWYK